MIFLESFDDLDLPEGLFPENCEYYIQRIATEALRYTEGLSLDEINVLLQVYYNFYYKSRFAWQGEEINNAIKETVDTLKKRDGSIKSLIEHLSHNVMLIQYSNIFELDRYEKLEADITSDEDKISEIKKSMQCMGVITLYFYLLALRRARKLYEYDWPQNNRFFRYGRVANYLIIAERTLAIPAGMARELSVLQKREEGIQAVRQATSRKGGKTRVKKYDELKKLVFKLHDKKYSKLSNRQAGIRIYNDLKGHPLIKLITAEYPEETLAKWGGCLSKKYHIITEIICLSLLQACSMQLHARVF